MSKASVARAVALSLLLSSMAFGTEPLINLEWRPMTHTVAVGQPVDVGLYAVCNPGETQLMRAADVVFTWDPTKLQFLGINNTFPGTLPALSSTLPANDPYHLNGPTIPPTDGNGYYRWWANLGQPVTITDQGSLMTTFQFIALEATDSTIVDVADSGGDPLLYTRILGSSEAGTVVTGTLGSSDIRIVAPCSPTVGDVDGNGLIELNDVAAAVQVLIGVDTNPAHVLATDANCDGVVNGLDIQPLIDFWLLVLP
jgi:hypothetical protein